MQQSMHRGVCVAPEPMSALASRTVQPRRELPRGVHLHLQGVLVIGRHTSMEGNAQE